MNIYDYAIKMEIDGENYYNKQGEINKGNSLEKIFHSLAKDEEHHAQVIQSWVAGHSYELTDSNTITETKNIFSELSDFTNEIRKIPNQLDVYLAAFEKEKKSIELYEGFLAETTDAKEKELLEYIVSQEKQHYTTFDELIKLVNRPNDWVEAAEFGRTEEY